MKVSYNWIKEYLTANSEQRTVNGFPKVEEIAEVLNEKAFEVENIEKKPADASSGVTKDDHILDIDVLPNRAHDCLCHLGIAKEIALNLNLEFKDINSEIKEKDFDTEFNAKVEDNTCKRYMLREVSNVQVGNSPEELKNKIESLGEKSINNIVDITNIVLFELGQPMHAFDKNKLDGNVILARTTKQGENMTTLDGNFVEFDNETCVIADSKDALAIAGVKGGNKAEVDLNTKSLILESANFDSVKIRQTTRKVGISTESSKRYENHISPEFAEIAMNRATELLIKYGGGGVKVSNIIDIYPKKEEQRTVEFSVENTQKLLGIEISKEEIIEILDRFGFEYEGEFKVKVPFSRKDLEREADMIEEIGRVYGYDKIEPRPIEGLNSVQNSNQEAAGILKIKNVLQGLGFSEVQTYSFVEKGDLKAVKALASDKQYLRTSLEKGMIDALELNHYNADLIGLDTVKIFEIGKIYPEGKETLVLGLGVRNKNFKKPKVAEVLRDTLEKLQQELGISIQESVKDDQEFVQIELTNLISKIDVSEKIEMDFDNTVEFKALSSYPFMTRDISVWIPNEKGNEELVYDIVAKHAGDLLRNKKLFDVYEKDGKTSYGVRVVFQSNERTLTDEEVGRIMDKAYKDLETEGLEIR